jgi:hypothetical protein
MKVDRTDPMSFFISVMRNPDAPFEEVKDRCSRRFARHIGTIRWRAATFR